MNTIRTYPREEEKGLSYEAIGLLRMKNRKLKRLAKFTKHREDRKKNLDWCPCCGRSRNDYWDY